MADITIVFMGFINQLITGGHHPVTTSCVFRCLFVDVFCRLWVFWVFEWVGSAFWKATARVWNGGAPEIYQEHTHTEMFFQDHFGTVWWPGCQVWEMTSQDLRGRLHHPYQSISGSTRKSQTREVMGCWVVYSWLSKTNSRWKYVKNCYANNGMVEYKHLPKSADINYDMNNYVASINWFNIHVIMRVSAIIINHQSSTSCYQPWWSINPTCSKANSAGAGLRSWVVCSASFMQSKSARPKKWARHFGHWWRSLGI